MSIEELEDRHFSCLNVTEEHTKLSIEFAISVLKEVDDSILHYLGNTFEYFAIYDKFENKIQELKQYLDERNNN